MVKKVSLKLVWLILSVCALSIALSGTMLITTLKAYFNGGTIVVAVNRVLGNLEFFADITVFSLAFIFSTILIFVIFHSTITSHDTAKRIPEKKIEHYDSFNTRSGLDVESERTRSTISG